MTCPIQYDLSPQARTYAINRQIDLKRQKGTGDGPVTMVVMTRPGELGGIPFFMDGVFTSKGSWRVWRSWSEGEESVNNFPHSGACNMSF